MSNSDLFQQVTNQVISALEKGGLSEWVKPWVSNGKPDGCIPYNLKSKNEYSGINIISLWASAYVNGFSSMAWLTYKQVKEMGGNVIKGSKGTRAVFYKPVAIEADIEDEEDKLIPVAKSFTLFNLEQVEGLEDEDFQPTKEEAKTTHHLNALLDSYMSSNGIDCFVGNSAFYRQSNDSITLPDFDAFVDESSYLVTKAHECAHSTLTTDRLNRKERVNKLFQTPKEAYAFEELVAECCSIFFGAKYGVTGEHLQHESYIGHWLERLKNDNKYIFKASAEASKAFNFILEHSKAKADISVDNLKCA